jgi:hypothetical protein
MNEFSRIEIFNSYLFLRSLLGLTNKKKDDSFLIGIRYTGKEILALNENSTKVILLITYYEINKVWLFSSDYLQLEPLAKHIKKAVETSKNPFLSEPAFDALREILSYED